MTDDCLNGEGLRGNQAFMGKIMLPGDPHGLHGQNKGDKSDHDQIRKTQRTDQKDDRDEGEQHNEAIKVF